MMLLDWDKQISMIYVDIAYEYNYKISEYSYKR